MFDSSKEKKQKQVDMQKQTGTISSSCLKKKNFKTSLKYTE